VQITIDKLIYGGDGLGRLPAGAEGRAKTVFVPFVLEGEQVDVAVQEERPSFLRASAERIVEPSPDRVTPRCPHFGTCGGCHYQHATYPHQLESKRAILEETLRRTAKIELEVPIETHSAEPWHFRNRTRMRVQAQPDFAIGYFRHGSHDLLPVRECPISSPLINRALAILWTLGERGAFSSSVREVQFFANAEDSELLIEIYLDGATDPASQGPLGEAIRAEISECRGVVIFRSSVAGEETGERGSRTVPRSVPAVSTGEEDLVYRVGGFEYRVSAGSFFQTNRHLVAKLVSLVTGGATGKNALDLYAGAGLFTLPLAKNFERVVAVEVSPYSFPDLQRNAPVHVKAIQKPTEQFLHDTTGANFDLVVVDPPRAGLGESASRRLGRMRVSHVTYVSCDPSTLARDLRTLLESGFRVEQAHLVDLFPQTFHIESVFQLAR